MVIVFVNIHPFASLSVRVYVDAHKPVQAEVEQPPVHEYVYAPVPPDAVAVTEPVQTELHARFDPVTVAVSCGG